MTSTYINAVCDQLKAAAAERNGAAATRILAQIAADGHPRLAGQLTDRLILAGLRRLAAQGR